MSPETKQIYDKMIDAIRAMRKEHRSLMIKAKNKTITPAENNLLRQIIKAHNKIEKLKNAIWENHSLVKVVMKQASKK